MNNAFSAGEKGLGVEEFSPRVKSVPHTYPKEFSLLVDTLRNGKA